MSEMIAWATMPGNTIGADPGITITYYGRDGGITQEHDLPASDLDRAMLGDRDGDFDPDAADKLLTANGYERERPWADSGGQWGAQVSLRNPDD